MSGTLDTTLHLPDGTLADTLTVRALATDGSEATLTETDGVTPLAQPVSVGTDGSLAFGAADGTYSLEISRGGELVDVIESVVFPDTATEAGFYIDRVTDGGGRYIRQGSFVVVATGDPVTSPAQVLDWNGLSARQQPIKSDDMAILRVRASGGTYDIWHVGPAGTEKVADGIVITGATITLGFLVEGAGDYLIEGVGDKLEG